MTTEGPRWTPRHVLAASFMASLWRQQLHFVVAAYDSPQQHFGYQP